MVLSNKKLKQKLREAKVEQLAASELAQNHSTKTKDLKIPGNPTAEARKSIQSLLEKVTHKPRLSKREKRREKGQSLQKKIPALGISDGGDVKEGEDEGGDNGSKKEKKKKKRKRGESEGGESEEVKEAETAKKPKNKKKKKKKGKKKKNAENGEGVKSEGGCNVMEINKISESKVNLDNCPKVLDNCPKVYVGGIPYYSTEDDIRSYFESCGTITEIDCMTFPDTGKFRGIAIITFKTEAAAKRALAFDGCDMGGLYLMIQPYKSTRVNRTSSFAPAAVEGYNRIYAGNLSWDITEDDLRNLFSGCTITSIRFGEDKETGEFKGYAHIDFADSLSLNMALRLDQRIVCGRPIKLSYAVPKKGAVNNSQSAQRNTQLDSTTVTTEVRGAINNSQSVQQNTQAEISEVSNEVTTEVTVVSSKIRRRTCYECGERGHLSSSCPNKQQTDQADSVAS